jgi:bifunctional non-homologous end joining protein LigD
MAAPSAGGDERDGVPLTSLDDALFEGANATKRDLVDYPDGVADHLLTVPVRVV